MPLYTLVHVYEKTQNLLCIYDQAELDLVCFHCSMEAHFCQNEKVKKLGMIEIKNTYGNSKLLDCK